MGGMLLYSKVRLIPGINILVVQASLPVTDTYSHPKGPMPGPLSYVGLGHRRYNQLEPPGFFTKVWLTLNPKP